MQKQKPPRILLAKAGLDGHDRGIKALALGLREYGVEVIYLGLRQSPETIVRAAIQEDIDMIGLGCHTGTYRVVFPEVIRLLREKGAGDIPVIAGGMIPKEDIPFLTEKGIKAVFTRGSLVKDIADYIKTTASQRNRDKAPRD